MCERARQKDAVSATNSEAPKDRVVYGHALTLAWFGVRLDALSRGGTVKIWPGLTYTFACTSDTADVQSRLTEPEIFTMSIPRAHQYQNFRTPELHDCSTV